MSRSGKRAVAGRVQILNAARAIGVREGWRAVTIRAVARELGYSSPLLYEHFRDKEDLLTRIAVEGLVLLEAKLTENLPAKSRAAVLVMIERYWTFMLENTQLYRLMNGMDGVSIDREAVNRAGQSVFKVVAEVVRPLAGKKATEADAQILVDELWALLHGMATLYLDRSAPFDPGRVANAALRLITGASRIRR
jgi:AcrR family transcriptional regulator